MNTPPSGSGQDAKLARALVLAQDLCARLDAERSAAELEANDAKAHAAVIEDSIAFRLGSLLLSARSLKGLAGFPRGLTNLIRHWRARKTTSAGGDPDKVHAAAPEGEQLPGAALARAWHQSRRPDPPEALRELRMAAVVDEFTEACFAPDCTLLNLPVDDFERQLDEFQPHLLFVESAWRGESGGWTHKVHPCSRELRRLVGACRRRGIPTVFWCKEDPSHFDNFIEAAALFDHVFTTDSDCVPRYRERLGHDRVQVLGFGCQPAIHNPLGRRVRAAAASFAGSWYAKYPERAQDFEALVAAVQQVMPVEIYDRNHSRNDPAFEYPVHYRHLVRAGVPYGRMPDIYKMYDFSITINTVTRSPTMFARRVFELLACNTITISNYSAGLDRALGDLVIMDDRDDVAARLTHLRDAPEARDRLRLRGLREVMHSHTVSSKLIDIVTPVLGPLREQLPAVWVIATATTEDALKTVLEMFRAQRWSPKNLLIAMTGYPRHSPTLLGGDVRIVDPSSLVGEVLPTDGWISVWNPQDYYGPCYLLDLMQATRYSQEEVIGKSTRFRATQGGAKLFPASLPYTNVQELPLRCSIVRAALLANYTLGSLAGRTMTCEKANGGLAIDPYSYCAEAAGVRVAQVVDVD